jgi:predicted nucleotidyltransferase
VDVARPYTAIVPSLDGDVLVVLAGTRRPLTGRQVAERAHRGSQSAVAAVLDRLVDQGLVLREQAGRAYLHVLNREHLAGPIVESLADLRSELIRRLRQDIESWETQPASAVLFGSTARADGDAASDIDLLVIRPDEADAEGGQWRTQLERLAERVVLWTGNHAAIIELAESELLRLQQDDPPIVTSLRQDGVDLAGRTVRKLFRAQA